MSLRDISPKYLMRETLSAGCTNTLPKESKKNGQQYFFEEYCRPLLTHFLGGWYGVRITKGSRIDYQRYYNWDLKVHSIKNYKGGSNSTIILNDKDTMDRIIKLESGIGFIVLDVEFTFDVKGSLRRWRDKYEDRTTGHTANSRVMKSRGKVTELKAIYIKDMSHLE